MNPLDADRYAHLARALQTTPRQLLVAAARIARLRDHAAIDTAQQSVIVHDAARSLRAAEGVAALLLTPIASYAQDDADRALASLWPADR